MNQQLFVALLQSYDSGTIVFSHYILCWFHPYQAIMSAFCVSCWYRLLSFHAAHGMVKKLRHVLSQSNTAPEDVDEARALLQHLCDRDLGSEAAEQLFVVLFVEHSSSTAIARVSKR